MNGGRRRLWLVARREWNQRVRTPRVPDLHPRLGLDRRGPHRGARDVRRRRRCHADRRPGRRELVAAPDAPSRLRRPARSVREDARVRRRGRRSGRAALGRRVGAAGGPARARLEGGGRRSAPGRRDLGGTGPRTAAGDRPSSASPPSRRSSCSNPLQPSSTSLEPLTKERSARDDLASIGLAMLFMAIVFYGGFLLIGVVEEKSSRVVEVLLSRLRPTELLAGKILGIGLVGLAQFALVAGSALVALRALGEHPGPRDDAEHDRVDRVLVRARLRRSTRSCTRRRARWSRARRRPRACSSRSRRS